MCIRDRQYDEDGDVIENADEDTAEDDTEDVDEDADNGENDDCLLYTSTDVQAATKNGFKTEKGKSYYYQNGQKVKGWLTLNGKKYFFNKSTGVQMKRWAKDSKGCLLYTSPPGNCQY